VISATCAPSRSWPVFGVRLVDGRAADGTVRVERRELSGEVDCAALGT
jgi:hypothetical protein